MKLIDFKSKAKAINYIKYNLNNFDIGEKIDGGNFFELLNDLVNKHYNSNKLIGSGISYFFAVQSLVNKRNRTFNIMRKDGSVIDFSYLKAISGKTPTHESYVKGAFRVVINPFVKDFKEKFFNKNSNNKGFAVCEVTGLKITIKNCHIDHTYPHTFDSLFYKFLKDKNVLIDDIKFNHSGVDNRPELIDENLIKSFYDWHAKYAKLRCIYWRANLQGKKTNNFNKNK